MNFGTIAFLISAWKMNAFEQRALDWFHAFCDAWLKRIPNPDAAYAIFTNSIHSEFRGIGTGKHEIFHSKADVVAQFEREMDQVPGGAGLDFKWENSTQIADAIALLTCEVTLRWFLERKEIQYGPIRMSGVLKFEQDDFYLAQIHTSLPDSTMEEEVFPGSKEPRRYDDVTVLFTDFVGFTQSAASVPAEKLVNELDEIFAAFDEICLACSVEKVKTIGDAYMVVSGLKGQTDHARNCVHAAQQMLAFVDKRNTESNLKWEVRIGIHSGPVVGGVIGREKLSFDLWGDTVNLANRMESAGEPGKINVSAYTCDLIRGAFPCTYRGKIETKDGTRLDMYFVD